MTPKTYSQQHSAQRSRWLTSMHQLRKTNKPLWRTTLRSPAAKIQSQEAIFGAGKSPAGQIQQRNVARRQFRSGALTKHQYLGQIRAMRRPRGKLPTATA